MHSDISWSSFCFLTFCLVWDFQISNFSFLSLKLDVNFEKLLDSFSKFFLEDLVAKDWQVNCHYEHDVLEIVSYAFQNWVTISMLISGFHYCFSDVSLEPLEAKGGFKDQLLIILWVSSVTVGFNVSSSKEFMFSFTFPKLLSNSLAVWL